MYLLWIWIHHTCNVHANSLSIDTVTSGQQFIYLHRTRREPNIHAPIPITKAKKIAGEACVWSFYSGQCTTCIEHNVPSSSSFDQNDFQSIGANDHERKPLTKCIPCIEAIYFQTDHSL